MSDNPLDSPLSQLNVKSEMREIVDINVEFGNGFNPELLKDKAAVNGWIANLLETFPGQRWWYPNYASPLRRYQFELVNNNTARAMQMDIQSAFRLWLGFITIICSVNPSQDETFYEVSIAWNFQGVNMQGLFLADFYPS